MYWGFMYSLEIKQCSLSKVIWLFRSEYLSLFASLSLILLEGVLHIITICLRKSYFDLFSHYLY